MITPNEVVTLCKKKIKREWKIAFISALLLGLLIHLPVMLSDIPNHDGLGSMYFDQNMITSGRWFLTVACGFSSYFTLPWLIGLLGIVFLACAAVALTEILEIHDTIVIILTAGLLVAFPALASTFAYVFTLDGYMLALLLAILSVLFTKRYKRGFLPGAVCLAFSMGIYQAYLPFAVILCIYCILVLLIEEGAWKDKLKTSLHYLYMGVIGVGLYYIILQILLKVQGKELADYQGISGMTTAGAAESGLLAGIGDIYKDFLVFTVKGNILCNNIFSVAAILILAAAVLLVLITLIFQRKWWKKLGFFVIIGMLVVGLPIATNMILIISPEVNYHLLMRYQWVLYPVLAMAFVSRYGRLSRCSTWLEWALAAAVSVLVFNYAVMDHIGYSNLEKRYEKTYAYCVRLLDRIEQTEGYYQGIPIAIMGVVGYEEFPTTDITEEVTGNMIGLSGDTLLYTAENYQVFMKNYLGATLNFLDVEAVGEIYYTEEYMEMVSFPGADSVKVVDGILYVKTENATRD
ncbi:MAG: hypothetical protein E7291_03520 [Lachnospiraceae bacterium]|nr:hypothetical protein [Lachnospiraceae bacterium]